MKRVEFVFAEYKQVWVGREGIMRNQAGKVDKEAATLRAEKGGVVGSLRGEGEVLVGVKADGWCLRIITGKVHQR